MAQRIGVLLAVSLVFLCPSTILAYPAPETRQTPIATKCPVGIKGIAYVEPILLDNQSAGLQYCVAIAFQNPNRKRFDFDCASAVFLTSQERYLEVTQLSEKQNGLGQNEIEIFKLPTDIFTQNLVENLPADQQMFFTVTLLHEGKVIAGPFSTYLPKFSSLCTPGKIEPLTFSSGCIQTPIKIIPKGLSV